MNEYIEKQCETCDCDLWINSITNKSNYTKLKDNLYCDDCLKEMVSKNIKLAHKQFT